MPLKRLHQIIRIILILIPVGIFVFLLSQDLVWSGKLEAVYDFSHPSPFITPLAPSERVSEIKSSEDFSYQTIIDDPIYFDLRLPRRFSRATFSVVYKAKVEQTVRLAAFIDKDAWHFGAKDFTSVKNLGGGWQEGTVDFDLTDKKFANQKYQFMISLPEIKNNRLGVEVREIKMIVERPVLTLGRMLEKIKQLL